LPDQRAKIYYVFPYVDHDLAGLLENSQVRFDPPMIKCYLHQILEGIIIRKVYLMWNMMMNTYCICSILNILGLFYLHQVRVTTILLYSWWIDWSSNSRTVLSIEIWNVIVKRTCIMTHFDLVYVIMIIAANLLISSQGILKITDFGLARPGMH
jgi:serine/threonine protein kinase